MLHSASSNDSGIPQQLLEAKQKEIQERREREAAIQVGGRVREWWPASHAAASSLADVALTVRLHRVWYGMLGDVLSL